MQINTHPVEFPRTDPLRQLLPYRLSGGRPYADGPSPHSLQASAPAGPLRQNLAGQSVLDGPAQHFPARPPSGGGGPPPTHVPAGTTTWPQFA